MIQKWITGQKTAAHSATLGSVIRECFCAGKPKPPLWNFSKLKGTLNDIVLNKRFDRLIVD